MSIDASHTLRQAGYEPTLSRGELVELMREITAGLGAEHYVVVQCLSGRANEDSRILACNWVFDALQAIGQEHLARIVRSHLATPLGSRARPFTLECLAGLLPPPVVDELKRNGHHAFACQQLQIGQARFGILFSAAACEGLDEDAIAHAHMISSYALSRMTPDLIVEPGDPLSERERECLRWVSEGKTTDEVALILGVSSNTVNSYVTHAIQKLSASNRAMAMATAIRNGLI
ncbi:MAG: helix-turn-helix transcriptional regulator [Mesorhizobium sp.]|nr:helix-turn-helix transcriptional regulator [Mesorhizobium sp.]